MWTDNETERDFLNFSGIAATVAEVIRQAQPAPVSVGVSGAWGVGKSSLIKLIKNELSIAQSTPRGMLATANMYVFVEFNAWLYQGYDDARAALLDTVASTLAKEADARKKGTEKAWEFVERVNLLRLAKMASSAAAVIAAAHPVIALAGTLVGAATKVVEAAGGQSDTTKKEKGEGSPSHEESERLIRPKKAESPPKEIQALRDTFEEALQAMEVTLVVLIDDLDRCLPETAISTLEAIRLLLFLPHTAFVIAADETMIKHAVRRHFEGVEDALVTNYFDKLIQVPIRVPQLGVQEVRAYLMMLFIEDSTLDGTQKEELRQKICGQLGRSWQGKRVNLAFVKSLGIVKGGVKPGQCGGAK
jgi:predicted KAP-like P-loop ATPase